MCAQLSYFNFHLIEVVSRYHGYRDPQLQVSGNSIAIERPKLRICVIGGHGYFGRLDDKELNVKQVMSNS